jgi:hypothetical protein
LVREIRVGRDLRPSTVDIVRRHLASRQGAPFRRATLIDDIRRLDALRLFTGIDIRPVAAGADVALEVEVKETLRILPFVALSVTEENGVSAGPAFRGTNLLGRGSLSSGTTQFGGAFAFGVRLEADGHPGRVGPRHPSGLPIATDEVFGFDERAATIAASAGWNRTSRVQIGGRAGFVWCDTGRPQKWNIFPPSESVRAPSLRRHPGRCLQRRRCGVDQSSRRLGGD